MKLIKSLVVLFAAVAMVGGVTYAYFSDTGTSTANTFTAGTLNLQLTDNDETDADDVTISWTMPTMAPGDSVSETLALKNAGSLTADHVEINPVVNGTTDVLGDNAGVEIDEYLEITAATYTDVFGTPDDLLAPPGKLLVDSNGNGWIDLDDLEAAAVEGGVLDNLPVPSAGGIDTTVLAMTITFRADAGNEYQGDSDVMDMTFTLNQNASQ